MDRLRRVPCWAWALLFSIALCLPRLGAFGFWDPSELKIADQAREIERSGHLTDPTAGGHYPAAKPLGPFLAALGIKIFGAREMGARLFGALAALGALMAVYWAGAGLFRRRAGLLGTLVLGSMVMFVLEARQLTSDAPLMLALALAMGGLGRYAWPPTGTRRLLDLAIGVAGMALGYSGGGALIGIVLPSAALFGALAVGYGLRASAERPGDGSGDLAAPGIGPHIPAGRKIGSTAWPLMIGLGVTAAIFLIFSMTGVVAAKYSVLLGGAARAGAPTHTFEYLVRQLGFGLFPWSAVAVFALARPLIRLDEDAAGNTAGGPPRTNARLAFGQLFLFFFAGLGFALSAYLVLVLGDGRYTALPAIALAIGVFLDEGLEGNRSEPVAGLLILTGTLVVARDFFLTPEELVSVHLADKVHWPATVNVGNLMLALALLIAGGVYAGLAARGRAVGKLPARDLTGVKPWKARLEQVIGLGGRYGLQAALGLAVAFAFFLTQYLVPALSTHFSFKPVLESFARFAKAGEKIGRYRVEGKGSGFYGTGQTMVDLQSQAKLVEFLNDPARVFALVSADELAALDNGFKSAKVGYYVVDASSSRFLLLSNRLAPGEPDLNPLKKDVWMAPTPPAPGSNAWQPNERPPWTWRINVSAVFADAIELVGANFPPSIRRPGKIPLELIFRVGARPPAGFKIFVHFDGPAAPRLIGDHDPLNKTFGTAYWLPGEYIRDHYDVDVPLMTTPAGSYTVLMGFWPGGEGKRLKVTSGSNDGADRVRLGTIEIK
ncbi:MAG TPA: glycosyltransferase family 39 protein [Polyangia bacterium]|nr:glycosyltransferase family 39 protein [Polyangia bacterium]